MNEGVKSIAKNALYLSVARAVGSVARIIYAVLLATLLGPELYGMFNLGLSWSLIFLPISFLGLDFILMREIGRNREMAGRIIGQTLVLRSLSSFFVSVLCLSLGFYLEDNSTAQLLLLVFSVALFGRGMSQWVNSILKGYEISIHVLKLETFFRLFEVILGTLLLFLGASVVLIATVHAASWVFQGLWGYFLLNKKVSSIKPHWDFQYTIYLIKQGFPFLVAALLGTWLLQGGAFFIRFFYGYSDELGYYMLALQAFLILGAIVAEIGHAALPVLTRSFDRGDGKGGYFIEAVLRLGILLGGVLAISGHLIGGDLILWIFGKTYFPVAALLPSALLIVANYFLYVNLNSVLISSAQYIQVVIVALVGCVVFSSLSPVFFNQYSSVGVLWATGVGMFVANLFQIAILRTIFRFNLVKSLMSPMFVIVLGFMASQIGMIQSSILSLSFVLCMMLVGVFLFKVFSKSEIESLLLLLRLKK